MCEHYEKDYGFSQASDEAKALLIPYPIGEATKRYCLDAAIRASLEKIYQGKKRILLYSAKASDKTIIAVHLLNKNADAGQICRALFFFVLGMNYERFPEGFWC